MIYLYFAGAVITFVILCSFANKEGWTEPNAYTSKEEAVVINIFASSVILFLSLVWPLVAFTFGLMHLAKMVGKIDIKFNFGDKDEE